MCVFFNKLCLLLYYRFGEYYVYVELECFFTFYQHSVCQFFNGEGKDRPVFLFYGGDDETEQHVEEGQLEGGDHFTEMQFLSLFDGDVDIFIVMVAFAFQFIGQKRFDFFIEIFLFDDLQNIDQS